MWLRLELIELQGPGLELKMVEIKAPNQREKPEL
jgi:hypothetical protein